MGKRKTFEPGNWVEVQQEAGFGWDTAEYIGPLLYRRGWHEVELLTTNSYVHVPSRRIRAKESK